MRTPIILSLFLFAGHFSIAQQISLPLSSEYERQNMQLIDQAALDSIYGQERGLLAPCCSGGPPANDNFESATPLTVGGAVTAGVSCGATIEAGETLDCNNGANQTVWYKFTANNTTSYVQLVWTGAGGAGCYGGSAIWAVSSLPTGNCHAYSCQSASNGPLTEIYQLATVAGQTYNIQVTYTSGGPCGSGWCFNINVQNSAPGGTIYNTVPANANGTCATAVAGCYLNQYNPTVSDVQAACTGYPATNGINKVNTQCYSFNVGNNGSGSVNIQEIVSSNCGPGNVTWANWTLYDELCNIITCGNLSNVTVSPVVCNTNYTICWSYEVPNCTHTQTWPYVAWSSASPPNCALPIDLLSFETYCGINAVIIDWSTASETNNSYFNIERSADAMDFQIIGRIEGAGNSNHFLSYSFTDKKPLEGISYYRLKQTDFDGRNEYFDMTSVSCNDNLPIISIYPNPNNGHFFIDGVAANTEVTFLNIFGEVILKSELTSDRNEIDLSYLHDGFYLIRIGLDSESAIQKLIISR